MFDLNTYSISYNNVKFSTNIYELPHKDNIQNKITTYFYGIIKLQKQYKT